MNIAGNQLYNLIQLEQIKKICHKDQDIKNQEIKLIISTLTNNLIRVIKNNNKNQQQTIEFQQKQYSKFINKADQNAKDCYKMYDQKIAEISKQIKQLKHKIQKLSLMENSQKIIEYNKIHIQENTQPQPHKNQNTQFQNKIISKITRNEQELHFILLKLSLLFKQKQIVPIPISAKEWVDQECFHFKNIKYVDDNTIAYLSRVAIFSKKKIIYGQKCKYSIFLSDYHSAVYFGLADQTFSKLQYFPDNSRFYYQGSEGTYWDGVTAYDESGPQFSQYDTITMIVDSSQGTIQWNIGRKTNKINCKKLKQDRTIQWVPYVSSNIHVSIMFVE